jgi:hypothetical protein
MIVTSGERSEDAMAGIRDDIAALGATWNKTIEWYARVYNSLSTGTGLGAPPTAVAGQPPGPAMPASTPSASPPASTLVGSNSDTITVAAAPASSSRRRTRP